MDDISQSTQPFWLYKKLEDMTQQEWESLCDGCAWCCLYKLEDEDTHEIFFTSVACRLLELKTCRCIQYEQRLSLVDSCIQITPELARSLTWLPETCAYRRIAHGLDLPEWHPLKTGVRHSVHFAGASALGRAISEKGVDLDDLEDYVIDLQEEPEE